MTTIQNTLITFHTGRGGRFNNSGFRSYCDQDQEIDYYTDDLFVNYENSFDILKEYKKYDNILSALHEAIECDFSSNHEKILIRLGLTAESFGKKVYQDGSGNPVGLDYDNDGTGSINIDNDYNTTTVVRLSECDEADFRMILDATNWKSGKVEDYCKTQLAEMGVYDYEEEIEECTFAVYDKEDTYNEGECLTSFDKEDAARDFVIRENAAYGYVKFYYEEEIED